MGCFLYTEQLRTVTLVCGVKLEKKPAVSFVLKTQNYRFVMMHNFTHMTIG
jgi:hypothetical protein